jgi:hypothetical protein
MPYSQSPTGVGLAVGTVLTELLDTLIEQEVLTRDEVEATLQRSLTALSTRPYTLSHTEALELVGELLKRFQKSSA